MMDIGRCYKKIKDIIGLSLVLASANFKLKNEGSYLGIFWYLLNPILTFGILFLIFNDRLGGGIHDYWLYLLLGTVVFDFFQTSTIEATKIVRENKAIIKSIHFPQESLVLGMVVKNLFSHLFELFLIFVLMLFFKMPVIFLSYYLIILIPLFIFILGASFLLSCLAAYFTDLDNIWAFAVRLLWLVTPIFYSIGGQARLLSVNLFNPLYYFITMARDIVINHIFPSSWILAGSLGYALGFLVVGWLVFYRLKIKFAEMV